ncbi:unnamed protein product [Sphacelaria rigidula]
MQRTEQGTVYYVDHISKRTSWEKPQMSSNGSNVIPTQQPDIPPAELIPDSTDLYMGADLLNRFFASWSGDCQGKSPLEGARNVIVTSLTTSIGLKAKEQEKSTHPERGASRLVNKGRGESVLQRYLYLSPNNKQIVWASKAGPKGKSSKKGLLLDNITALECYNGAVRVESRGEASPLTISVLEAPTLTPEGGTILLGVLLADMTGATLKLEQVNGGSPASYFPASFVNEVLRVRQARAEANAAATIIENPSKVSLLVCFVLCVVPAPLSLCRKVSAAEEVPASATPSGAAATEVELSPLPQVTKLIPNSPFGTNSQVSPANSSREPHQQETTEASVKQDDEESFISSPKSPVENPMVEEPVVDEPVVDEPVVEESAVEVPVVEKPVMEKRAVEEPVVEEPIGRISVAAVAARFNGGISPTKNVQGTAMKAKEKVVSPSRPSEKPHAAAAEQETPTQEVSRTAASETVEPEAVSVEPEAVSVEPEAVSVEPEAVSVETSDARVDTPQIPVVVADEDIVEQAVEKDAATEDVAVKPEPAVEQKGEEEEEEEDEEEEEYRAVLLELLRPVKLERFVENFVQSGITLDILPLVERKDLETVVGITEPVPQLKVMKQIKKRFPDGI